MGQNEQSPAALAGAHRAETALSESSRDFEQGMAVVRARQVRSLLKDYVISLPLAAAICELAFSTGRRQ